MWQLVISGPGYFDTAYDLPDGETSLGRSEDNDIVLSGDLVSRRHARIVAHNSALSVEDLGSRNGSRINGRPFVGTCALKPGDTIAVGENTLTVRQPGATEEKSGIKRVESGPHLDSSVVVARKVRDSALLKALDNFGAVDVSTPPVGPPPGSPLDYGSLALLYRVAESLSRAQTLRAFLDETVDRLLERVNAATAVLMLRHPSGVLAPAAVRHRGKLEAGEVPVSDAILNEALEQGAALAVRDVRGDHRYANRESVLLYGVDQVLCVPIGEQEPFLGALYLNKKAEDQGGAPEQLLDVCTAVARLIGIAAERFQLREQGLDEERLRIALARHHGPGILEERVAALSQPEARLSALEEKPVTLLHAELAGFSYLARKASPKDLSELLEELYGLSSGILFSFGGTLERFSGDGLRALFGAPQLRGGEALRAVRAAVSLRRAWERVLQGRPADMSCPLKMVIHSGTVLAGTVGTKTRLEYVAAGEPMAAAASLCAGAEGGQVLVTAKALADLGGRFDVTPLGERVVSGGADRISVFELVDEDADDQFTHPGQR